jgi:DNA-directed RNA polymerase specialized sigma24 family protein
MGNGDFHVNPPTLVRSLAVAMELVTRSLRFWRIPAQVHREDVLQEACLRWLQRQAEPRSSDEVDVRILLGIARNVLREWRRAEVAQQRLRASLGRDEPSVLEPLEGCDFRSRTELSQWLGERLPREEVAVLLAVRLDGSTWCQACREFGIHCPKAAATMQRRILRFLSDEGVQKSFLRWMEGGVDPCRFPSLPFPSLPFPLTAFMSFLGDPCLGTTAETAHRSFRRPRVRYCAARPRAVVGRA